MKILQWTMEISRWTMKILQWTMEILLSVFVPILCRVIHKLSTTIPFCAELSTSYQQLQNDSKASMMEQLHEIFREKLPKDFDPNNLPDGSICA